MMRRRIPRGVRLALSALFLAAGAGRSYGLTPCPHHQAVPAQAAHHAGHAGHGSAPGSHQVCTCVGACHLGAATMAPAGPKPAHAAVPAAYARVLLHPSDPRPAHTPYLLPYSTAPPAGR